MEATTTFDITKAPALTFNDIIAHSKSLMRSQAVPVPYILKLDFNQFLEIIEASHFNIAIIRDIYIEPDMVYYLYYEGKAHVGNWINDYITEQPRDLHQLGISALGFSIFRARKMGLKAPIISIA